MANVADLETIESLYEDFSGEFMSNIVNLDKAIVKQSIIQMVNESAIILGLVDDKAVGFIAGYIQNCHFSNDVMFLMMYFYVNKEYRKHSGALLNAVEQLLRMNTTVTKFCVSSPAFTNNDKLDRFYQINGFKLLEKHFFKDLK